MAKRLPKDADQQVKDVARRCALVAAAGEMATEWGILPWSGGEATRAAETVLALWLGRRGDAGSAEESQHVKIVRSFLAENGASRFVALERDASSRKWVERHPDRPMGPRAGWRRPADLGSDKPRQDEYLILPDAWEEMCSKAGADPGEVAKTLKGASLLNAGEGNNLQKKVCVPAMPITRMFVVRPAIFGLGETTESAAKAEDEDLGETAEQGQ